ncbi:MFS transporter [Actinopolymorpha pittospori]
MVRTGEVDRTQASGAVRGGAPPTASVPGASAPRRFGILAVLLVGQFMANVDTAIVNVAAPSIRSGFDVPEGQVSLVVSGYIVAFAVLLVTGARLGATHGHRRMFVAGLLGFTAASLACGLAPGIVPLVLARLVQGAAAALMVPQVLSGIQLHFTGAHRVRALGFYAMALSGGAVAGQVLGGLLVAANLLGTTWRPIFLINVPLGAILLVAAVRVLPPDSARVRRGLDPAGVVALSVAVLALVVPLVLGREEGWPAWTLVCLVASVPALACFVAVERRVAARGGRPLVASAVVHDPMVRRGLVAHGLTTATYFALLFVLASYLQQGLGASPSYAGLAMVSWVAAFGLAGHLLSRVPARHLPVAPMTGCLLLATSYASVLTYLLLGGRTGPLLFVLLGVGGLGLGVSANSLVGAMTSALPARYATDLSGVINTNAQLSGALGVAVASTAFFGLWPATDPDPAHAFAAVLAGFVLLVLVAATVVRPRSAKERIAP